MGTVIDTSAGESRFDPRAWRFLLAERSNCVFIEWEGARGKLTDELVDRVATVSHTLGEDALMLVDYDQHIEALIRAESLQLQSMSLNLDVHLHAIALTPGLVGQLPTWNRTSTHAGFSALEFKAPFGVGKSVAIRHLLELLAEASSRSKNAKRVETDAAAPPQTPTQLSGVASPAFTADHSAPSDPRIEQLLAIRKRLRDSVPMLDANEWAQLRGNMTSTNPTSALSKYKAQNRLFSVNAGRRELYPQFQFDEKGAPLTVIADVLAVVPEDARGWPLLSWFDAHNSLVAGRKPREAIRQDPTAVKNAAAEFYSSDD